MNPHAGSRGDGLLDREARFSRLYAKHVRPVLAYAVRRAADRDAAADVVAETFLVAWRRLDDVPSGDPALMLLYGVARRILANQQRGERRRERLAAQLGSELESSMQVTPDVEWTGRSVRDALSRLASEDQEVLRLVAWEGLSAVEVAKVLGLTQVIARSRLHRARKRLRAQLERSDAVDAFALSKALEA